MGERPESQCACLIVLNLPATTATMTTAVGTDTANASMGNVTATTRVDVPEASAEVRRVERDGTLLELDVKVGRRSTASPSNFV